MHCIETEDLISGSHTFVRDKSCTEHNHNLDTVDVMKRPEALKTLAGIEVANGYSFAAITETIRVTHRPAEEQAFLDAGGKHFDRIDVKNAGKTWRKAHPDSRFIGAKFSEVELQTELTDWLETGNYMVANLIATRKIDGANSPTVLFAAPHHLTTLRH